MTPDDDDMAAALADEMRDHRRMELVLQPATVFAFVGVFQLAKRHPALPTGVRVTIETFLDGARAYFADCPFVLQAIERGDDQAFDQ